MLLWSIESKTMKEPRKRNPKTKIRLQMEKANRRNRQRQHEYQAFKRANNGNQRLEVTQEEINQFSNLNIEEE